MPTISIHTDDADFTSAIVRFLLAQTTGVRWFVEGDTPYADPIDLGPPPYDGAITDFGITEADILAARAATNEPHPVVRTIGEIERERLIATWDVKCPKCKASPGEPCHSPTGTNYGTSFVHNARRTGSHAWTAHQLDEV